MSSIRTEDNSDTILISVGKEFVQYLHLGIKAFVTSLMETINVKLCNIKAKKDTEDTILIRLDNNKFPLSIMSNN